ncbi:MAG: BCCT family transporter, partial [Desulfovibrionales bacterium]|nr:BCCT family transporter [Desulfovibrionales bacterium]
ILASVLIPPIGTSLFYLILGGSVVNLHLSGGVDLIKMLQENGAPFVIIELLHSMRLIEIILPLFILIGFVYQATSFQGAAFSLAGMASAEMTPDQEPAPWHRLFWALVLGVLGFVMIVIGGLKIVQLSSVILAIPAYIIIGMMIVTVSKWMKEDFGSQITAPPLIFDTRHQKPAE